MVFVYLKREKEMKMSKIDKKKLSAQSLAGLKMRNTMKL
jgi:hypothetical protein